MMTVPSGVTSLYARVLRALARIDPNDDPSAEPLTPWPLIALAIALGVSLHSFLHWKIQPMQDLGHHLALAAVSADRGRPGSLFTELYEPMDRFAANSLLYTLAGWFGRMIGVTNAVRASVGFYLVGVPLAGVVGLRMYGRSAWGAVLATAVVYDMVYVAGFANLLFAAPFVVIALPLFHRALERRTAGFAILSGLTFVTIFLAHAHAFLWTGALAAVLAVGVTIAEAARPGLTVRRRASEALTVAGLSLLTVTPSLLLFARWYRRTFGDARTSGGVMGATATAAENFGAYWKQPTALMTELWSIVLKKFERDDHDIQAVIRLLILVAIAVAVSRLHRYKRAPVLELACAATVISYFVLPEGLTGHDVLGSRQISLALWFLPAVVAPIPARTSKIAHAVVVAGILYVTGYHFKVWRAQLAKFADETAGLSEVLAAAPPRQWLHYVKTDMASSTFAWRQFMHVDKYYSSDGFGQIADTPAILSTSPIRYLAGVEIHRVADHSLTWPNNDEIMTNFDLILVRRWNPSPELLAHTKERADLVKKSGDWQLWRSKVVNRH